jgi:hypothetical protein
MPFYIRVTSLINPVHCITQTEEPKIVNESGTEKLKERERLNKMTEEEIDQAARSDPDALPVEDEEIWKQGRWVDPEPLSELVRTC